MVFRIAFLVLISSLLCGRVFCGVVKKHVVRRCSDTSIAAGYHKTHFLDTQCNSGGSICGGDPLLRGTSMVKKTSGVCSMTVNLRNANPWNLYSVYFLPMGANPCTDLIFIGEFFTDGAGKANKKKVRDCSSSLTPQCLDVSGTESDPCALIPSPEAGNFFYYSRGIMKEDIDGDGMYDTWKTDDTTYTGTLNNPTLWGGASFFDGIQFIGGI